MDKADYNTIVIITLVIFFGLSLLVGIIPSRKASKGFLSFMIADKALPWWAIGGTLVATYVGAPTLLGFLGSGAKIGLTSMWLSVAHCGSFMMLALFFVPILIRMKRVTLGEPLGERYGMDVRQISSGLSFFRMVGSIATNTLGIGLVISTFTTLNLAEGVILGSIVLIIYVAAGGMYGVAYADTFQGIIILCFLIIAPVWLLTHIGDGSMVSGFGKVLASIPRENLTVTNEDPNRIAGWMVVMLMGNLLRPELFGRIYAARNPKEGILTWVVATDIAVFIMIIVCVLGLTARYVVPDFTGSADQWGPAMFLAIAPIWLTVFYVLSLMAAATSTATTSMLGSASFYVTDFHIPIFYKNSQPSRTKVVWLSRAAVVFFTGLALWWALAWRDLISILSFSYTVLVAGILVPYIGMFFWPRMTSSAARWAAILGGGTSIVWRFVLQDFKLIPIPWIARLDPSIPALLLSFAAAIVITYLNEPEYEKVYKFAKDYDLKKLLLWAETGLAGKKA
ncbi:MAG: sodium:solute symporter family protein [Planctomycetota bacterium]|nr:sodium:solute symporter family protein [Planctomycetota bacterium]